MRKKKEADIGWNFLPFLLWRGGLFVGYIYVWANGFEWSLDWMVSKGWFMYDSWFMLLWIPVSGGVLAYTLYVLTLVLKICRIPLGEWFEKIDDSLNRGGW